MNTISYHLPRCNSKNLIVNDILKDKGYGKSSIMIPVDSIKLPDYVTVGSIYRTTDDELVRYVPERTCKIEKIDSNNGCCSSCGASLGIYEGYDPWEESFKMNYCPECGAKVVK